MIHFLIPGCVFHNVKISANKIIDAFKKSLGEGQSPFMTAQATCTAAWPFPPIVTIVTFRAEQ